MLSHREKQNIRMLTPDELRYRIDREWHLYRMMLGRKYEEIAEYHLQLADFAAKVLIHKEYYKTRV